MRAAIRLSKAKPPLTDPTCFLCQQAVEKYLKAFLQEFGLAIPFIHDLDRLLLLLLPHDPTLRPLRRGLKGLTRFAVDFRYPGYHASKREMLSVLGRAKRLRQHVRQRLGLDRPPRRKKTP
jgi:HEPN domain-containing protein